ncbi:MULTISPECIES: STAS-like domain-containing protein [Paenibacillus]|uniref:STAS-like domain-containing protein n=1 Tax=Paenibacillus TaxID=44249 RepID=UPI00096CE26D|nr:STAS-like domain-containing protein [Paenibacillus odorifer]OME53779.1 hypothetical protein BSK61_16230 [Paenibacillus odorifer]
MEYKIQDIIGENCITREDGEKLYNLIFHDLKDGNKVTLDFINIGVFTSPFFNTAIGPLFRDFSREDLRDHLIFENLNSVGRNLVKIVIENSSKYFSDEQYRRVHDNILSQHDDEEE